MGGGVCKSFLQENIFNPQFEGSHFWICSSHRVPSKHSGELEGAPLQPSPSGCEELENQLCMCLQNLGEEGDVPGEAGFPRLEMACGGVKSQAEVIRVGGGQCWKKEHCGVALDGG